LIEGKCKCPNIPGIFTNKEGKCVKCETPKHWAKNKEKCIECEDQYGGREYFDYK
jgi:hypothetical protein